MRWCGRAIRRRRASPIRAIRASAGRCDARGAMQRLKVSVWRTDDPGPGSGAPTAEGSRAGGALQQFDVARFESQTVLDVVTAIQRDHDPTLAYRFACRVGMC